MPLLWRCIKMKPIVGIMPLWDDEKESIWMLPGYLDGLSQAGATPIIFPFSSDEEELGRLVKMCDGILFTGGHDISPKLYNEDPIKDLVSCCIKRDLMESIVLKIAMDMDKSILGICRGIQFINVALGGSLYQDLNLQHPSNIDHHQQAPYDIPKHEVTLKQNTPLHECLHVDKLLVNSYHHQAVKDIAQELEIMATSPDGLIEALYMPTYKFLWAMQWHPEFSYQTDINSQKIFQAFIDSMKHD